MIHFILIVICKIERNSEFFTVLFSFFFFCFFVSLGSENSSLEISAYFRKKPNIIVLSLSLSPFLSLSLPPPLSLSLSLSLSVLFLLTVSPAEEQEPLQKGVSWVWN